MDFSNYLIYIGAYLSAVPILWLCGQGMSCYYPFLLSSNHYVVVKNKVLRKLLISDRLNRSASTKTRIVDRNKLPVIGAFYYIVGTGLLAMLYISGICGVIADVSHTESAILEFLAALGRYWTIGIILLTVLSFICYQIDYSVGKLRDPNGGRL